MKLNRVAKTEAFVDVLDSVPFAQLAYFLSEPSTLYPNFSIWYNFTFRRNFSVGQRKVVVAHNGTDLLAAALLKIDESEHKICTFYVHPDVRGLGLGAQVMNKALELFDKKSPLITVSDERIMELSPLLKANGFKLVDRIPDLYRTGSCEHFFKLI